MDTVQKRAKVVDVARLANVSVATVSRVFAGKEPTKFTADTAKRVLDAARELNYTPSELGRSLRTSSARAVALLIPDATNEFCADVTSSLEPALRSAGLSMLLCNTHENPEIQDEYLVQLTSRGISAVVLLGAVDSPGLRKMSEAGMPLVFVSRRPPANIIGDFVGIDNHAAGRDMASHFLARGYQDCAVIHGPQEYAASRERLQGFRERMAEEGIRLPASRCVESRLTSEEGYKCALKLLGAKRRPRAIFCGNDAIAYGVHRAAEELQLRVPDDLALAGFDDNRLNHWLAPWLTTVSVPVQEFGPAIAELLREHDTLRSRQRTTTLFAHRLVIRDSA
ncbi:LacI family DNA-binding transcriptional regulator [Burkholderia sp. MR1-5-21]